MSKPPTGETPTSGGALERGERVPAGFEVVEELSRAGASLVLRARRDGADVVLRLFGEAAGELEAELGVLAEVRHPGLAGLVAFGSEAGRAWVAREWIEGRPLAELAGERSPEELGALLAALCPALEALHARGFVHADLKPTNVVVDTEGRPRLTDFGLAVRAGAEGRPAGSLYYVAPEVLLGGAATPRADLFALGVMLHEFAGGERAPASEFYARFPQEDFLEAAGADLRALPEWARDLVSALVERDPARRPASALEVGRALAARLGIDVPDLAGGTLRIPWPALEGREAWVRRRLAGPAERPLAWRLPPGEDAERLAEEVRLAQALAGRAARHVALGRAGERLAGAGDLDRFALAALGDKADTVLLVTAPASDAWAARAADHLARAWAQRAHGGPAAPLVRLVHADDPLDEALWSVESLPAIEERALSERLADLLKGEAEDVERLAVCLAALSGGASSRIEALLADAVARGWIGPGEERPRLFAGASDLDPTRWSAELGSGVGGLEGTSEATRQVLAALRLAGGSATHAALARSLDLAGAAFSAALAEGLERGLLEVERGPEGTRLALAGGVTPAALGLDEATWRRLAAALAQDLAERGGSEERRLALEARAAPEGPAAARAAERAAELADRGLAELAVSLASEVREALAAAGAPRHLALEGELASAWLMLGRLDRVEAIVEALAEEDLPAARALRERLLGHLAAQRHDHAAALAHFERAAELDPESLPESLYARARLSFEARRDDELDAIVARFEERADEAPRRLLWNLRAIAALSRFRRGDVDAARATLERTVAAAEAAGEALARATGLLNLATVERRTGELARALEHFAEAAALFDEEGHLPGLAQARAFQGGVLRDRGEVRAAEPLVRSAIALRERLGDRAGADAARGMLGLLLAERGHLLPAIQELEGSAARFEAAGRRAEAALARTRAEELRLRLGEARPRRRRTTESERALEADPRVLVSRARAAWLRGDAEGLRRDAERARDLANRLRTPEPREEAELLLAWQAALAGRAGAAAVPTPELTPESPRVREDHETLSRLAEPAERFDAAGALSFAEELARRGRADRAARLAVAVAARAPGAEERRRGLELARESLSECMRGLTEVQGRALERTLLGIPDPWVQDLEALRLEGEADEDWDMDVLSLLEINRRLVRTTDLPALLGTIVENAIEVTGAERGLLVLEEHGELSLDTARDSRRGDIADEELEFSGSVVQRALTEMRPLRVSNAVNDPVLGGAPSIASLELRSVLCVPFEVDEGLRGAIYVDHRLREGAFHERAERLLALLADQAALAILQRRRMEEIERLNRRLEEKVAVQEADLANARRALEEVGAVVPASGLVGTAPAMQEVHRLIDRFAPSSLPVLVCGPSGTGKELAARALHELSPRKKGPFVSENCAALPPTLIEAELFGYRKGAFTGADRDRAGMFERAHGGTLFLDEIGELAIELQAKLLRVLETSEVRRLGDSAVRPVDFRLVVATNRDLAEEVREGRFREDLYYRLDALRIELPPLSERIEDIPALVEHFLALEERKSGRRRRIAPAVMSRLCRREWPGNVRELANEVARLCVMSEGDLEDPDLVRDPRATSVPRGGFTLKPLAELERDAIRAALERCGGDKRRAAELLGISRAKIYQRLKEWREEEDAAGESAEA